MLLLTFKYCSRLFKYAAVLLLVVALTVLITSSERQQEIHHRRTFIETTPLSAENYNPVKFILLWTSPYTTPFAYFGKGSSIFKAKSCKHTNCFITANRKELGDTSLFDAILFNGPQLQRMINLNDFPKSRSIHQKYVYANVESAHNYPVCTNAFNNFFNWTWTYRLDSDSNWGYFVVKNKTKHVVAPKIDVQWLDEKSMEDVDEEFKKMLASKKRVSVWFASNCHTKNRREEFALEVQKELKKLGLYVDMFGSCGSHQCPKSINDRCLEMVKYDYYFYFAFENSFSEDYVTEKILNAYKYNTVPVVYGTANYSRFLPPGSYLNAYELGAEKLAKNINQIINDPILYHQYFKWRNHYSFHYRYESPDTDDYCKFCELLNNQKLLDNTYSYNYFNEWWNNKDVCIENK